MIAFLPTLGFSEMVLLVAIGLLLYGRDLPQAGRTMGRFVAQLKRGFQDFKDHMDRDESLREVRKTIEDTTREMRNLTAVPRAIADPMHSVKELARDVIESPTATEDAAEVADEPPPPAPPSTEAAPATVTPSSAAMPSPGATPATPAAPTAPDANTPSAAEPKA